MSCVLYSTSLKFYECVEACVCDQKPHMSKPEQFELYIKFVYN